MREFSVICRLCENDKIASQQRYIKLLYKSEAEIVASLEREIRAAITDGFQTFISGMARGVDIWAAEVVLRLRDTGSPIHLIAASPYQGFERAWSPK